MFAARNGFQTGKSQVVLAGTAYSTTTSITIPSHDTGNLIVIWAMGSTANTIPTAPSASGTVPTWTTINSLSDAKSILIAYAVASGSSTTSGTWADTYDMFCAVLTGQGNSPIGGSAVDSQSLVTNPLAPSITLSSTDGTSQILHTYQCNSNPTFSASPPSGYTTRLTMSETGHFGRMISKDSTTSDGSVRFTASTARNYSVSSLEIKAA